MWQPKKTMFHKVTHLTCCGLLGTVIGAVVFAPGCIAPAPTQANPVLPQSGDYYARGSAYSRSTRTVKQQGNRVCLSMINGPASPYEGYQQITVSSLFTRGDRVYRDGDGLAITVDNDGKSFRSGERAIWELLGSGTPRQLLPQEAPLMAACLDTDAPYSQSVEGEFIKGMPFPSRLNR